MSTKQNTIGFYKELTVKKRIIYLLDHYKHREYYEESQRRYKEGAEMYSMCQKTFEKRAKEAKAIYKLEKLVLVNLDKFEKYLELFAEE